ncbi:fumarylacetoacetate hydrolase family protein [Natrinema salifodinae]|uniref:2-dehydro-3-deoxy-D-xylonate dehydratase n=1 Tax=Natrinema salifodinae TaxID=1202768 RepID=A0A1I0MAM5_9EURY|nr:fumarylacetoacetate hydrolase family protein [Natrinema salifodinae]SEV85158.1 2-dehydro-3-deoxy-D-xylonate dehydratase [Natrinema salifodinae]
MRYYRRFSGGEYRLLAVEDETAYDLTAVKPRLDSFGDLAAAASISDEGVDRLASELTDTAPVVDVDPAAVSRPVVPEEVWAAGVTYEISEEAREAESGMPKMYLHAYEAERPEIFFKATPSRTVGPGEAIGIRADSTWDVPEPELGIVLYDGSIVGYTIGNDVSSREIEGENPLYLPQAKMYERCCSIGPAIVSADSVDDPHELTMTMEISRNGEVRYEGETSTGNMARTCEELVEFWRDHNTVPELGLLLTGTSLVPDDGFTLRPDDEVRIEIDEIGELSNPVIEV